MLITHQAVSIISKSILSLAQFDLCKWEANDIKLKKHIQISESLDNSDTVPLTDDLQLTTHKIFGVNWDTKTDKFVFDFREIATNALNLKICNTFFDLLGVLSPIVLQAKLIFKELCINKYEWDTDIDHDIKVQWNEFLKDLLALRAVSVRHYVLCCTQRNVELHDFCDSSGQAYCAVVFVRVMCSHGVSVTLWAGKCRLAPMKNFSIARLELVSCLLLSKLIAMVVKAVEV